MGDEVLWVIRVCMGGWGYCGYCGYVWYGMVCGYVMYMYMCMNVCTCVLGVEAVGGRDKGQEGVCIPYGRGRRFIRSSPLAPPCGPRTLSHPFTVLCGV